MKSNFLCALTIAGVTFGSIGAFAASTQSAVQSLQRDVETASGEVRSIDLEKKAFTLKSGEKTMVFTFSEKTKYTLDGREATRDEVLKRGQSVVVTHEAKQAVRVDATSRM